MLFLDSNLATIPQYTRSFENRKYKSEIRIGIGLRSCTNISGQKKDEVMNRLCTLSEIIL